MADTDNIDYGQMAGDLISDVLSETTPNASIDLSSSESESKTPTAADKITDEIMSEGEGESGKDSQLETPPTDPETSQPTPEVWETAPNAWKKEKHALWAGLPPEAKQYIAEREAQVSAGFQQYEGMKQVATAFNKVYSPYLEYFQGHGVTPDQAFQNLLNSHLMLKHGTKEQKTAMAVQAIKEYGLEDLLGVTMQAPAEPAKDPRIEQLLRSITPVISDFETRKKNEILSEVNSLFKKEPMAEKYSHKILSTLQSGQARDLETAYRLVVASDPAIFAEYQASKVPQVTPQASPKNEVSRKLNLKPSSAPPSGKPPQKGAKGSWEKEVDSMIDSILKRDS